MANNSEMFALHAGLQPILLMAHVRFSPKATNVLSRRAMKQLGQSRHIRDVCDMSAKPPQRSNDASQRALEMGYFRTLHRMVLHPPCDD